MSVKSNDQVCEKKKNLRFPVVSCGAEYLVQGYLMRRNILTYKAPPNNEGYDLICIHPDPRNVTKRKVKKQVRVQVKSRYATDCDRGFPLKGRTLDAFDFVVVAFLNIGNFYKIGGDGNGAAAPELYTLPHRFVKRHYRAIGSWERVRLRGLEKELEKYKGELGFNLIANALGIAYPARERPKSSRTSGTATAPHRKKG